MTTEFAAVDAELIANCTTLHFPIRSASVTAPDVGEPRWGGFVPVRLIPGTASGDYCGSLVEASNYRVLLDSPESDEATATCRDRLIELYRSPGYTVLAWPAWCPLTQDLSDAMLRMEEYPLLSEDDHSALAWEVAQKVFSDAARRVRNRLASWGYDLSETLGDHLDALTDDDVNVLAYHNPGKHELWRNECGTSVDWDEDEMVNRIRIAIESGDIPPEYSELRAAYLDATGSDR